MMRIISVLDWTINLIAIGVFVYFYFDKDYENAKTTGIIAIAFLLITLVRITIAPMIKRRKK
jgi:membrane protein DedA with SNARE-associated domain